MNAPVTLLLTATIAPPPNCPDLIRADPLLRLADYSHALQYYLAIPSSVVGKIIFAENSNYDLSELERLSQKSKDKEIEFLSFEDGNNFPPEFGKGYGEMLLMNYALDNSTILKKDDIIWKGTGRLILNNIQKMIAFSPSGYQVYCDLHNEYKALGLGRFFDPRFYSFTLDGYNTFFRMDATQLKGAHIEHLYYDILVKNIDSKLIIPRFNQQPQIEGHAASDNKDYYTLKKQVQRQVQSLLRRALPHFWI